MKLVQIDASRGRTQIAADFAHHFGFPDWFGGNWDALDDCLHDALAKTEQSVRIHVCTANADEDEVDVLASILGRASAAHDKLRVTMDQRPVGPESPRALTA